jgi:hypothetical protein
METWRGLPLQALAGTQRASVMVSAAPREGAGTERAAGAGAEVAPGPAAPPELAAGVEEGAAPRHSAAVARATATDFTRC